MKALVGLIVNINTIHSLFIAHDFSKHLESKLFVQKVQSLSGPCTKVLLCEEVKELFGLKWRHSFCNEDLEELLDVAELNSYNA